MITLIKLDQKLKALNPFSFIIVMVFISYLLSFLLIPIFFIFQIQDTNALSLDTVSQPITLLIVSIIAPILETLLFQSLVFSICYKIKFFKERKHYIIFLSATFFALAHGYNSIYILYSFLGGIIFAYSYSIYIDKEFSSTFIIILIHSLKNTTAFIITLLSNNF